MQEKITILLVDDQEPVALAQAQAIRRLGYGCVVAHSGEAAVHMAASNPEIALVLMDADLGKGIDSREAARRILAARDLPIVFMASHPERRKPATPGFPSFRYVSKDSGDMEMKESIEAAFELFASHREAKKSEEWQRLILATVPVAIYVSPLDPATDASWVSGDIEKVTGFTPGQYMAEKDFWRKRLHPDDRQRVLNSYKDPAAGDEIVLEYRWRCQDGNYKWFYDWAKKKHTQRGIEYFGIILDISERKRAEEMLKQANLIVENSPVVIFRWKASEGWPVTMVSKNVSQFGYSQEELLSGKIPYAAMVYPEDLDRVTREVLEYSRGGADSFHQEYRVLTKDGRIRWVDDNTVIERDVTGEPLYFQGVIVDVTDSKNMEIAFAEEHLRLLKTLDEVRTLRGIIPICAHCKQIRDDKGYWSEVEKYVSEHTNAEFSHGICPKCMEELYPEFAEKKRDNRS